MNARQQITSLCEQIVEKFKPQKVILFGSYAYGPPTSDSDIDLLVVMPFEGRAHRKAVEIRKGIESSFPLDLPTGTWFYFKRVHDLKILLDEILVFEPEWNDLEENCIVLTDFAVAHRYQGWFPVMRMLLTL